MRNSHLAFFALAIAFITIGLSSQRTFLWIGVAFLVIFGLRVIRGNSRC